MIKKKCQQEGICVIAVLVATKNPVACLIVGTLGNWLALLAWVPIIGDLITLALGFYKAKPFGTMVLLLVGKFLRFLVWNLLIGAL